MRERTGVVDTDIAAADVDAAADREATCRLGGVAGTTDRALGGGFRGGN